MGWITPVNKTNDIKDKSPVVKNGSCQLIGQIKSC